MKCVHEANHITEAHMILHLLEQEDFNGTVDGEYLQGAVGELPAMGMIRVVVSDEDYEQASAFLKEWHAKQITLDEEKAPKIKNGLSFNWGYLGFFSLGVILSSFIVSGNYFTSFSIEGIDYNGDGVLEEKDIYKGNRIQKTEIDTDLDGQVDTIYFYDSKGRLDHYQGDHDFNGTLETTGRFANNVFWAKESDTNGDGKIDLRYKYKKGILKELQFLDSDGSLIKNKNMVPLNSNPLNLIQMATAF